MRTVKTTYIDDRELERIIRDVYGVDYSVCASEEVGNGDNLHYTLDGHLNRFDEADMESFSAGTHMMYRTRTIMNDLCRRGAFDPGHYIVEIYW